MTEYGEEAVVRTLRACTMEAEWYNRILEGLGVNIDEIALLVSDNSQLEHLDMILCRNMGWEKFNTAHDAVKTAPIRSSYTVEYHFFRHPDVAWRLEVMRLSSGVSPLHSAIPLPLARQVAVPVHASFKTPNEEQYAYARGHLENQGFSLAQQCDSTYGRFSYFTTLGLPVNRVPYVKPRVNLRDAVL